MVDSVAYAARQAPRNLPRAGGGPRKLKALPPLPSTQSTTVWGGGQGGLGAQQMAELAKNKKESLQRKRARPHQKEVVLPEMHSDDEDPFGLGSRLDG